MDEFVSDYKKHLKKGLIFGIGTAVLAPIIGSLLGGKTIKKFFIGNILGGLIFGLEGMNLFATNFSKKDKALQDKHNVQELFYLKKENDNLINKATNK